MEGIIALGNPSNCSEVAPPSTTFENPSSCFDVRRRNGAGVARTVYDGSSLLSKLLEVPRVKREILLISSSLLIVTSVKENYDTINNEEYYLI